MNKLMFTVVVAALSGAVSAQEIIAEADAATTKIEASATVTAKPSNPVVPAIDQVNDRILEMDLTQGYNPETKAIIQCAEGSAKIDNPAEDSAFMGIRSQLTQYAILKAKADIISAISSYFVAGDVSALARDPEADKNVLATTSAAGRLAAMPLMGTSVFCQAESWDPATKQYSVAVAVVWSPKLEAAARTMIAGDAATPGKPGAFSRAKWVKAQDWSSMVGARRFTDNKGHNLFVGIAAIEAGEGLDANANRAIAQEMARKNTALSLYGDVAVASVASEQMKMYPDKTEVTRELAQATASAVELKNFKGCMMLAEKTVTHPITGKRIYVCAYYIDPILAVDARGLLKDMAKDAGIASKYAGMTAEQFDAEKTAEEDAAKLEAAKAQHLAELKAEKEAKEKAAAEAAAKAKADADAKAAAEAAAKAKAEAEAEARRAKSTGGTFDGGTIDTDF